MNGDCMCNQMTMLIEQYLHKGDVIQSDPLVWMMELLLILV
jgi:hypothetical protein